MKSVEVCLSPDLIHQHELKNKVIVVVDIFRATSCIVTGLAYGIKSIHPVASVSETAEYKSKGMIIAGERGGEKVPGFDIGNSPYEYMNDTYRGKSVAVTTTNGTRAIIKSLGADQILIGAFLNLRALSDYLLEVEKDIVIHCAGWKGTVNIEDTLFAGALIDEIKATHQPHGDASFIALNLYEYNHMDLMKVARNSQHAHRLAAFGIEKDLDFCMEMSLYSVIPEFSNGEIILMD